ncbi:MAG: RNA polymerase sigma-70 factor [Saprospiraceae bacterium]|nr:RNA polymerase sigma-70 factor [Saprospiraceae bacterium]
MPGQPPHSTLDKVQFEQLFKSHFSYLCNFAKQYVQDADAAQDICQKVFIRLWEKRESMNPQQSIKSYLFTAVKNSSLNYIRDNKKYRSQVLDIDCGNLDFAQETDYFAEDELRKRIESALNSLPEKCRLVFEMSRYQDKKYKEIAEELDIAQKTVEAHMSKAIKALKEKLQDYLISIILLISILWNVLK